MPEDPRPPEVRLARSMATLANATRWAVLRQLRVPKVLKEIRVRARGGPHGGQLIARQTIKAHLDKLVAAGTVITREVERDGRTTTEYLLHHPALFQLAEEFRSLANLRATEEVPLETVAGEDRAGETTAAGPALLLVHGIDEGKVFDLTPFPGGASTWRIGRRRGLAVSLDFDPYLSSENSVVRLEGDAYVLEDLPENRNGTAVNFRRLPPGGQHRLKPGDVIGVGRCLLVFRA